jgi:hypothetical protein
MVTGSRWLARQPWSILAAKDGDEFMSKIEKADNRTNDAGAGQGSSAIRTSAIAGFKRMRVSRKILLIAAPLVLVIVAVTLAAVIIPGGDGNGQIPPVGPTPTASTPNTSYITDSLAPTNIWMNFYGLECTLDGQPLPAGSVITARDQEGILCGKFTVTQSGRYGLMPLYGNDPMTQVDEGAVSGDSLHFYINGILATALGPDEPVWTAMGDLKQVNLQASIAH